MANEPSADKKVSPYGRHEDDMRQTTRRNENRSRRFPELYRDPRGAAMSKAFTHIRTAKYIVYIPGNFIAKHIEKHLLEAISTRIAQILGQSKIKHSSASSDMVLVNSQTQARLHTTAEEMEPTTHHVPYIKL